MAVDQRVLVTGASGFIGRVLCEALVNKGGFVRAVVRSRPQNPVEGVTYIVRDLEGTGDFGEMVSGMDSVVHLAGRAHGKGRGSEQSLDAFLASNLVPTQKLAEAAEAEGVHRFVFLSSIGVHGDRSRFAAISEQSPEKPHAVYAESKLQAEQALKRALSGTDTSFSIIRPALVYGDNAPGNFGKLVRLCKSSLPLPLGLANNQRSLVSARSLVSLVMLCLERAEASNEVYVAADKTPVSTRALVKSLRHGMNMKAGLVPIPGLLPRVGLAFLGKSSLYQQLFGDLVVDAAKAVQQLGWQREENTLGELQKIGERAMQW